MEGSLNQQLLNSTFAAGTALLFHSDNDNHIGKFLTDLSILQSIIGRVDVL